MTVARGSIVLTHGPWSAGHQEQTAIVTHVYGDGSPGDLVNLHVFMDQGPTIIATEVPWYPTRADGIAARQDKGAHYSGAHFCYFGEHDE